MEKKMTAVGFEPTQLALVELESTPLDHSGKLSYAYLASTKQSGELSWAHLRLRAQQEFWSTVSP